MIFSILKTEPFVQVGDRTRIDASNTVANNGDAIAQVEISPDGVTWVDVTVNDEGYILDWAYDTEGDKAVSVRVNAVVRKTATISVLSVASDKLFSKDEDIYSIESELDLYLKPGRSTHLDKHREAQKQILEELNTKGLRNSLGDEITLENISLTKELNSWSKYLALHLIYFDVSKSREDVQYSKAKKYASLAANASNSRSFLTIDSDGAGSLDPVAVETPISYCGLLRR